MKTRLTAKGRERLNELLEESLRRPEIMDLAEFESDVVFDSTTPDGFFELHSRYARDGVPRTITFSADESE